MSQTTTPPNDDEPETTDDPHQFPCPVPECDYTNDSAQGVIGHVGSHADCWRAADGSPRDVYELASALDEDDSHQVAKVRAYLARHGVPMDAVRVFVHRGYGNVQIVLTDHLGDDWMNYRAATDVEGIRYVGGETSYCTQEFVDGLSDVACGDECANDGCDRTDTLAPVTTGSEAAVTLCRDHRKEYLGVSS